MTAFNVKMNRDKIKVKSAFGLITGGSHFVSFDAVSQTPVSDFFEFDKVQMIFMGNGVI